MQIHRKLIPVLFLTCLSIAQDNQNTVIDTYHFDTADVKRIEVKIDYSMGELAITDNGKLNFIDGTIEYFPEWISPDIRYYTIGSKGKLKVEVDAIDHSFTFHGKDIWKGLRDNNGLSYVSFRLPRDIPTDMEIEFGLGESEIDISNLSISEFFLECGLGETRLIMNSANSERCKKVIISAGLGEFTGIELGNLRGKIYEFNMGLGASTIDLTGDVIEDMKGTIAVGLGSLVLILPKKANIRLEIERSFLSSVNVRDLVQKDEVWLSPSWDKNLPTVEFEISVGLGAVNIYLDD
ncbi:MAG: hypothetical protein IIB44_06940 [Candidatus Marinimicrobia bacterium]|nr:hypothetical protein [Candidatus Neomarinimicrobiota bacterium]